MDITHHALIGGAGMLALGAQGQELAGLGFLAGSVFPDLDVVFMAAGKRFYLKRHQGPTHSLPLAPVYAAALAIVPALQIGFDWRLYLGLLAGLCIHVLLDLSNTFGIQLLWPITRRRFCFDAVFFIDAIAWGLTLGFYALVYLDVAAPGKAALGYAALFAAYVCAKLLLQRRVKKRLGVDIAIPSALNPFGFFLFTRRDGRLETATYNALTNRTSNVRTFTEAAPDVIELARSSEIFRDMQSILRALHVTRVEKERAETVMVAQDMAVRNFGGKFGRTELRFDSGGQLVHEMANI